MSALERILIKFLILILVIAAAGGGTCAFLAYRQSTPEYAIDQYLTHLIENSGEEAYTLLDQSENEKLTVEEYKGALEARKYSLYSGFRLTQQEMRRDENGNEYIDYHAEFLNAADEVKQEEDLTVKKQEEPVLGVFDRWKVQAEHCMVKDYEITVPTGSQLYLNNVLADTTWISEDSAGSCDTYVIPFIVPGDNSLTVRHPILESVNTALDMSESAEDLSAEMVLKQSTKDTCMETGVKALKTLLSSAVESTLEDRENLFENCRETAEEYVADQASAFHKEDAVFKNVAASDFTAQFGELNYTGDENGAIAVEMTFLWHYVVQEEFSYDTGEYYEDGTSIWQTETQEHTGDASAKLTLSYCDGTWHIVSMEIPVIPVNPQ